MENQAQRQLLSQQKPRSGAPQEIPGLEAIVRGHRHAEVFRHGETHPFHQGPAHSLGELEEQPMVLGDEAVATAAQRRVEALLHLETLAPAAQGLPEPVDDLKRCGRERSSDLGGKPFDADPLSVTSTELRSQERP